MIFFRKSNSYGDSACLDVLTSGSADLRRQQYFCTPSPNPKFLSTSLFIYNPVIDVLFSFVHIFFVHSHVLFLLSAIFAL